MTGLWRNTVSKWLRAPTNETSRQRRERPKRRHAFDSALKQALVSGLFEACEELLVQRWP